MKTLWLVRHAKSSWQLNMLPDNERPLNDRGYRDAHEMPARVLTGFAKPTCMLVSPAVRTYTTALIFARHLRFPSDQFTLAPQLYESGVNEYLAVLRNTASTHNHVMLFGHNPVITELANTLCRAGIENVPTCGIVCIEHSHAHWAELGKAPARLLSFDFPKKNGEEISHRDA
ncbi:MAG: histidine phosphatase family protein [Bacteroidia bacterium]|jgi:phosphohistidine phosphatase|nr:histidine phosphatase family protein [Bacteroidia bacterium]